MTEGKAFSLASVLFLLATLNLASCSSASDKLEKFVKVKDKATEKADLGKQGGSELIVSAEVDILFVIDDSSSMGVHQDRLAQNIGLFTKNIFATPYVDFHIGVITTSVTAGGEGGKLVTKNPLYSFVTRSTPNRDLILAENLKVGTGGETTEKVFAPLQLALTEPNLSVANAGFYRPNAFLGVVVITDTDDQSNNITATDMQAFMRNLKTSAEKLLVYSAYYSPTHGIPNCQNEADTGVNKVKLDEFFFLMGAKTFSLCDDKYGEKLAAIGSDLYERVARTIPLDVVPDPSTLKLSYGKQIVPNDFDRGWVYEPSTNSLVLGKNIKLKPEPEGTTFTLFYVPADVVPAKNPKVRKGS